MEGPVQNNNAPSMSFMNRGSTMNGEVRADGDHRTDSGTASLHHATMRVNSLSLSETPPLRKRNREEDDHSFRVDKMAENPSSIPRSQAMLSAEEYKQQQQQQQHHHPHQHQQQQMTGQTGGYGREDSLTTVLLPLFLPHSNSNGSTGSGSIMNMLASQDTMNQDPNMMQGGNSMQQPANQGGNADNKNMFSSFTMGDHQQFISGFKPGFVQGQGMQFAFMNPILSSQVLGSQQALQTQNSGLSLPSQTSGLNLGSQTSGLNLGSQTSGLNLPSQGSGLNLGSTTAGLNLGSSASGMNLGNSPSGLNLGSSASGLSLGPSTSGLNLGSQSSGLSLGNSNILGLNLSQMPLNMGGGMQPNVSLGMNNSTGNLGNGFQGASAFLSFGAMPPRGQSFESYMGDVRPRYDQGQVASGAPAFFPYGFPASTDAFMSGTASKRSPPGSGGAKLKKGGSKSKSSLHSQQTTGSSEKYVSWSVEQENALVSAVEELGTNDWEAIAARIPGGHRTGAQCLRHWENKLSPHIKRGQWSPEEDEALKKLVERASAQGLGLLDIPWEDIKPYIPGRTLKQVRERWRSNLDPSIIRGDWTPWEDEMIIKMRDEQGMGWASIARALKGRTEHSVKTRHRSMQRAKKRAWTEKEDRIILDMVAQGMNFSTIAAELKNRTATSVEMRWNELNGRS